MVKMNLIELKENKQTKITILDAIDKYAEINFSANEIVNMLRGFKVLKIDENGKFKMFCIK